MINLIRNEFIKIGKKKSIYITLLITLAFVIFSNVIYKLEDNMYSYDINEDIQFYEDQLKGLDLDNSENKEIYQEYKTELEIDKLMLRYGDSNTWQAQIIQNQARGLIGDMVYFKDIKPDEKLYSQAKEEYDNLVTKLDSGDWQHFAKEDLKQVESTLTELNTTKDNTTSKQEIAQIEDQIYNLEIEKQVLNWRLEKDICYGYDYYNQCLDSYTSAKSAIREYENSDETGMDEKVKYQNKQDYYQNLEKAAISQYDIENKTQNGNSTNAKGILLNIFSEFEIFIIIMAVMIAGTIVSEEFNKGTIKLLLIKPYKRAKILTSKFITAIIMLLIVIVIVMLMQFVVGGIIDGFNNFTGPTIVYNHNTNQLEEMSIIKYLALQTLGKLPIYILLLTLAFAISTLFTNSALAIAITLLGSMSSSIINLLALQLNLTWIKFFVTPNWDLTQYFFGGLPDFQGLTMGFSIAIILIYMVIMLVPSYIVFRKRNIKNI